MNRLNIVLAILGIGLALLIFNNSGGATFGMHNDDFARIVYLLPIALMMSAAVWASRQTVSQSLRNLLIWLVVIMALLQWVPRPFKPVRNGAGRALAPADFGSRLTDV